jgi:protease I
VAARQVVIFTDLHEGTDLVRGRQVTAYATVQDDLKIAGGQFVDAPAVVAGNVVTGQVPDDLPEFCRALIDTMTGVAVTGAYSLG